MENSKYETMNVEALMVDNIVKGNSFRRWNYSYSSLEKFCSPEPQAFQNEQTSTKTGIHLRWILPRRLREQQEDGSFLPIPNRWLITRGLEKGNGLTYTSWILESDCPLSRVLEREEKQVYDNMISQSCFNLVPKTVYDIWKSGTDAYRNSPSGKRIVGDAYQVKLGAAFCADRWMERASDMPLFLTACAPGNPYFSAYTPVNGNILSFYDSLDGIEEGELHYWIVGWYSDQSKDEYFSGQVTGIPWLRAGVPQGSYKDELQEINKSRQLHVAVGESREDVFRTYITKHFPKKIAMKELNRISDALAALFYHQPNYQNEQGGLQKLHHSIHDGAFEAVTGGNRYLIVNEKDEACSLTEVEKSLLKRLNNFANEVSSLKGLRFRLFSIWWKLNHLESMAASSSDIERKKSICKRALEYKQGTLLYRTIEQYELVKRLYADMPENGNPEACRQYGEAHGVESGKILKEVPAPRFWKTRNPSLLIAGVESPADAQLDPDGTASLRRAPSSEGIKLSQAWLKQIPMNAALLYEESKMFIEKHENLKKWVQPWRPMFAEWSISYYPVPFEGREQWWFDGTDYRLKGKENVENGWKYGGISLLDEHSKLLFQETLSSQIEKTDTDMFRTLKSLDISSWKLLGQEAVNLTDQIAQLDYRTFRRPYGEKITDELRNLDQILGFDDSDKDFLNATGNSIVCAPLAEGEDMPPFHLTQAGSCHIKDLILYDAFGRTLSLILSCAFKGLLFDKNFPLMVSERMLQKGTNNFLLCPRLLQPARLEVRWTEPEHKEEILSTPIVGFILINRFNHSLGICNPEGHYIGEMAIRVDMEGKRAPHFIPATKNMEHPETTNEKLEAFIEGQTALTEKEFEDFLDVLDKSLWSMGLSGKTTSETATLMGRPLALVHGEAWIATEGDPRVNIDFSDTGMNDTDIYDELELPVRLGDLSMSKDGLAGYYLADDLKHFYSTARPSKPTEVLTMIGPVGSTDGTYLHVGFGTEKRKTFIALMNPYGCVRCYSGLFPVKELNIPEEYVREVLRTMETEFRIGPLLTRVLDEKGISFPRFQDQQGEFSWIEEDDGGIKEYPLVQPAIAGDFTDEITIREGKLKYYVESNKNVEEKNGKRKK
ncbi:MULTISPECIES: hypothetical protein [Bacteroides]|jgi:hypothetical protein|uniref:hypothetical protein n=1 Tax=Bacteroides TaxID=816 RepID=UPI000E509A4E|nr:MULTISPECIES: hypothetical protein [Bacteroides]RHL08503.1 hypothetical protein DW036_11210 [Bacteroides sp. AF39-11AC]